MEINVSQDQGLEALPEQTSPADNDSRFPDTIGRIIPTSQTSPISSIKTKASEQTKTESEPGFLKTADVLDEQIINKEDVDGEPLVSGESKNNNSKQFPYFIWWLVLLLIMVSVIPKKI